MICLLDASAFFIVAMMQKWLQIHLNDTVTVAVLHLRAICRHICVDVDFVIIMTITIMINGAVWMQFFSVALV
jgi:hypothetical protein